MTTATLTGPRLSSAVRCSRRAAYEGLGASADPYPPETLRLFARGTRLGKLMAAEVIETLTAQGRRAETEVEVPWPAADPVGVGHADIVIPDESTVIEVVSSTSDGVPEVKATQAAAYALNLGCERAKVLHVDPASGKDTAYPVNLDGKREQVERIMAEVVTALRGGPLPERLNDDERASPGTFECQGCPFRRTCWDGWRPPPAGTLPDHLAEDVAELALLDEQISRAKKVADLEARRDELRARLEPHLEDGRDYIAAGVKLRRTTVPGRRSLRFADMEAAGWSLPPELAEFVAESKPSARWTTRILEAR